MVERVKTEIRNLLMPKGRAPLRFSLAIDGGSSNLANGAKLITVLVLSPELPCELVLGIELRTTHEDAVSQAELLEKLLTEFGLKSADVVYLVGDNVAVNKATVDLLRCEWDWPSSCSPGSIRMCHSSQCLRAARHAANTYKWKNVEYVRCLPHCLNLVMKAFLGAFDATFNFASTLKALRAFVVAGGSVKRRSLLTEFAVSLSGIDFADTRWLGFIKSIKYLMEMQTERELARASEALAFSAAAGDESAAAAIAEPGAPQLHINALYDFVEGIVEDEGTCVQWRWRRVR